MSIKFEELAIELKSSVGELTNLAETLGLPFAVREPLTNEDADRLRKSFREQPKGLAAPQLNPAPIRNVADIQQTDSSSVTSAQEEDPTESALEATHHNLEQANAAQETQDQELFENELSTIAHQEFRLGAMKAMFAETKNVEGFMAGKNALAAAKNARLAKALKAKTATLAGTEGTDFLPNYPNPAQSSTEIPKPAESITEPNLDILNRLKKS